jgi:hypothetical protein
VIAHGVAVSAVSTTLASIPALVAARTRPAEILRTE